MRRALRMSGRPPFPIRVPKRMLHAANAVSGIPGRRQMERRHRNMAQPYAATATAAGPAASSIADPAPLGLAGFGFTTLLLSLVNAKILPATLTVLVLSMALAFGGLGQLVAGMWAFKRGNTFAATAFTAYGAFWISFYLLVVVFIPLLPKPAAAGRHQQLRRLVPARRGASSPPTCSSRRLRGLARCSWCSSCWRSPSSCSRSASSPPATASSRWAASSASPRRGGDYTSFADVANANFKRRVLPT